MSTSSKISHCPTARVLGSQCGLTHCTFIKTSGVKKQESLWYRAAFNAWWRIANINVNVSVAISLRGSNSRIISESTRACIRWEQKCRNIISGKDLRKRNVLSRWRKTGKEGDDWMSNGKEFQRTDAATGNERHPTVDRRNGGTCSSGDDRADRRRESADSSRANRTARETSWQPACSDRRSQ